MATPENHGAHDPGEKTPRPKQGQEVTTGAAT